MTCDGGVAFPVVRGRCRLGVVRPHFLVGLSAACAACLIPDTGVLIGGAREAPDASDAAADVRADAPADSCAEDGLIAFYRFDESGTIAHNCVAGGSALDAVLSNAALVPSGRKGGGLMLTSDGGYAAIQGMHAAFAGGSITVTAWIRPTDYSNSGRILSNRVFADGGAPTNLDFTLESNGGTGKPAVGFYVNLIPALITPSAPTTNAWTHVAAIHRATGASSLSEIWFSGVLVKDELRVRDPSATPPRIGNDLRGSGLGFRGVIDDVRIYARALAPAEVLAQSTQ